MYDDTVVRLASLSGQQALLAYWAGAWYRPGFAVRRLPRVKGLLQLHLRIMTYNVDGMSRNDRALLSVMPLSPPILFCSGGVRNTAHATALGQH